MGGYPDRSRRARVRWRTGPRPVNAVARRRAGQGAGDECRETPMTRTRSWRSPMSDADTGSDACPAARAVAAEVPASEWTEPRAAQASRERTACQRRSRPGGLVPFDDPAATLADPERATAAAA